MAGRPTHIQIEHLVDFLENNPGIAKGVLRTAHAKLYLRRKWSLVASTLNGLGGAVKDGQGWAKNLTMGLSSPNTILPTSPTSPSILTDATADKRGSDRTQNVPTRRRRRLTSSRPSDEMNCLVLIKERGVKAEMKKAEALSNIATAMLNIAAAMNHTATALEALAASKQ